MHSTLAQVDWNLLLRQPEPVMAVVIFLIVGIVLLGVTIAVQMRKVQQAKYEAEIKGKMIESGFSPEEIVQVLGAGMESRTKRKHRPRVAAVSIGCCGEPVAG